MVRSLGLFAAIVSVAFLPSEAFCWNSTGHRVVALIAFKSLDDTTKAKVCAILKDHPAADSLWIDRDINSSSDNQANMFLNAATFPDDAKIPGLGFSSYNRRKNHYVNFKLTDDHGIGAAVGDGNLLQSFSQNLTVSKSSTDADDRAVALSWIFHQVGDAHQPLHAVARFSSAFPQGDEGGNLVKPFPDPRSTYKELHAYWDDLLGSDHGVDTFAELSTIATGIMTEYSLQSFGAESSRLDIAFWTKDEGGPIAQELVYKPLLPSIDNGSGFTMLPADYEKNAMAAGRKRIALAGYRLAEQLKVIASTGP